MKANPHAFFQIATFDTALSNDPSFKDAWGPRETRRIWGWEDSPKGAEAIKKKTHRRAVGVFCESAPAALEPSGPKKRINEQNVWAWLPKQKMLMFHRLTFQKTNKTAKSVSVYIWTYFETKMK